MNFKRLLIKLEKRSNC